MKEITDSHVDRVGQQLALRIIITIKQQINQLNEKSIRLKDKIYLGSDEYYQSLVEKEKKLYQQLLQKKRMIGKKEQEFEKIKSKREQAKSMLDEYKDRSSRIILGKKQIQKSAKELSIKLAAKREVQQGMKIEIDKERKILIQNKKKEKYLREKLKELAIQSANLKDKETSDIHQYIQVRIKDKQRACQNCTSSYVSSTSERTLSRERVMLRAKRSQNITLSTAMNQSERNNTQSKNQMYKKLNSISQFNIC